MHTITISETCPSTHGLDGYMPSSYWDGPDIICGFCGKRIKNPPAFHWDAKGQPVWPDFIGGQRGVRFDV